MNTLQLFPLAFPTFSHNDDFFSSLFDETVACLRNPILKKTFIYPQNVFVKKDKDNNPIEFCLSFAFAGFSKDEISVSIESTKLTILVCKNTEEKQEKESDNMEQEYYLINGISNKSASITYSLISEFDTENIKTSYKDGILNVSIPYKIDKNVRQIEII